MDIHRCRFIDYPPSAINCLAFSHSSGKASRDQPLRLAVGRANGNIEIWDPRKGVWLHEKTLYGGRNRSVDGLAWAQDPEEVEDDGFVTRGRLRLFSIGYSSTVTEWDLVTGLPLRQSGGSHSEVWSIAAQPVWSPSKDQQGKKSAAAEGEYKGQDLVAGCADGSLVLLSTAEDGLVFRRFVARAPKKGARALSLAFQSRNIVVAGFSDSAIRVYDIRNGALIRNISTGGGPRGGSKETLVWAVTCLRDGTIVSGDSQGEIGFWDARTYGQLQRIKGHEADVLCLAANKDGNTVFSGGMDRRTCVYNLKGVGSKQMRWTKSSHRRFHSHDVKTMASFENKKMSLIASGGVDTSLVITPLAGFESEYHRTLPHTPQAAPLTGAQRLLVSWWGNELQIYKVNGSAHSSSVHGGDEDVKHQTLAQMTLKSEENITSARISPSGKLLAVGSVSEIKLFRLLVDDSPADATLKIKKLETPSSLSGAGASLLEFSADGRWLLAVGQTDNIRVHRVAPQGHPSVEKSAILPTAVPLHRIDRENPYTQNWLNGPWGSYDRTVNRASISADGRIIAVSDLAGYIDTWVLEGHEDLTAPALDISQSGNQNVDDDESGSDSDSDDDEFRARIIFGQHWVRNPNAHLLLRLPSPPLILSFRAPSPQNLHTLNHKEPNGNPAVHPTRHNPHAHANTLPTDSEDRLLAVTAMHEVFELHALGGRLTEWSRRNTTATLPAQFKLQRDRAVGCIWDLDSSQGKERLWLYASSWLCMFDLAQDLPAPSSSDADAQALVLAQNGTHRKRRHSRSSPATERKAKRELLSKRATTGAAGSKVRDAELGGGISERKMRKLTADGRSEVVPLVDGRVRQSEGEDEDEDMASDNEDADGEEATGDAVGALHEHRRREADANGDASAASADGHDAVPNDAAKQLAVRGSHGHSAFYLTQRYRPILGIVPLTPDVSSPAVAYDAPAPTKKNHKRPSKGASRTLEVALVERPAWDLDLPARFVGAQEWEK